MPYGICSAQELVDPVFPTEIAPLPAVPPDTDPWIGPSPAAEQPQGLAASITAVSQGRVQIEGGYLFLTDRVGAGRLNQHTLPDMLLRLGLTSRFELRLGWPGFIFSHLDDGAISSTSHDAILPNVGFMYDVCPQQGLLPQTAVLASVPISLSDEVFAFKSLQPLAAALYGWDVSEKLSLIGTTGLGKLRSDEDDFLQFQQTLAVQYYPTDRLSGFVEWMMLVDSQSGDDGAQHLLSAGAAYQLTGNLQMSLRSGVGLNDRAPDFLTGIRFALRF